MAHTFFVLVSLSTTTQRSLPSAGPQTSAVIGIAHARKSLGAINTDNHCVEAPRRHRQGGLHQIDTPFAAAEFGASDAGRPAKQTTQPVPSVPKRESTIIEVQGNVQFTIHGRHTVAHPVSMGGLNAVNNIGNAHILLQAQLALLNANNGTMQIALSDLGPQVHRSGGHRCAHRRGAAGHAGLPQQGFNNAPATTVQTANVSIITALVSAQQGLDNHCTAAAINSTFGGSGQSLYGGGILCITHLCKSSIWWPTHKLSQTNSNPLAL
ncbi:hypothetical protein DFH09DRAFT_1099911 [Mycena vulgaris]|nr:hypothetical protein DFH09DRAFT_1099911 [Mycena vulgaris]